MKKPSNFPTFTNITTNDASLVNLALNTIWQYMQSGGGGASDGVIPGTTAPNRVRLYSPDNGITIEMQKETSPGVFTDAGIDWLLSNITPSSPSGFGLQQQLTTNWGVRDNGAGNLIFQKLIGGVWTDTSNVIS